MARSTVSRTRSRFVAALTGAIATIAMVVVTLVAPATPAEALSGSSFDPRYIISDDQFYDGNAMTAAEIQAFLNSMARPCTNSNCLNIVRTDTFSRAADRTVCGPYTGAAQETTAQIIFKVQQACGISAKVLLVTLQKEQGLITHSGPSDSRLGRAMGYACPDSAGGACDAQFYGLYNQIYKAAWQLKRYSTPDRWGTYYPGPPLAIAFHPNRACGVVGIAIRNNATAALYNYTPYVPNYAALGNLGGTGDACSSYGNRNFWYYYSSWFGSPTAVKPEVTTSRLTGLDRFDTSAKLSQERGGTPGGVVYITNGLNFPDALSAAPAAIYRDAPLLLVAPTFLPDSVRTELQRLAPSEIVVLGAEDSVSTEVYDELATLTTTISRVGGVDRYDTSRQLALGTFTSGATLAYLSTGEGFADALSAGPLAGAQSAPLILVPGSAETIDAETITTLTTLGVTKVIITGGPTTVSAGIEASLRSALPSITVERITGTHRFATASALISDVYTTADTVIIASGRKFPDALAGAALAGSMGVPLMITDPHCIFRANAQQIIDLGATNVIFLGGPDTLNASVMNFQNCD